ncbi:transglutaminase domain-containing protein [Lachnospiraceae bacterium 45-W7]
MKRRYTVTILMMLFFVLGTVKVQAETKDIRTEYVTLTDENRFKEEYYQKPKVRYPVAEGEMYRASRAALDLEQYIVEALENYQQSIDVSAYQIPTKEVSAVFLQILNDNPGMFYVDNKFAYSYYSYNEQSLVQSYHVSYLGTPEEIDQQRQELEAAADQAAAQAEASMTDLEKALVVHDYLVQNCEYDYDRLNNGQLPDISHTAYGALVNRMAVCDGYGDAYIYIMKDKLGISCELVASDAMAHAWNMIEIDGKWYHVDVTWDDPVRDSIGRVGHKYFLLSDTAISDASHEHEGWSTSRTADSTLYDDAFWTEITSSICWYQGEWYFSRYQGGDYNTMGVKLLKKGALFEDAESEVYKENVWTGEGNSYFPASYMYLAKANDMMYFNTKTAICRLDAEGMTEEVYKPQIPSGQWIFGFTVRGKEVWYALQNTPQISSKQVILTYALPELDLREITGVTAEDVTAVYNGTAQTITVSGIQEGDEVQYAGDNGSYQSTQPEMIRAGIYQVRYRVKRQGYQPFEGTAQVKIEKAIPVYTVPEGLKGTSGKTLASVTLPEGFSWQTDTDTKLYQEGSLVFLVKYTPEDSENYVTVTDIEAEVAVSCPGHNYTSEITKQPTETEDGEETFTCVLCGHSYTEVIQAGLPQIEGIESEDVTVAYDGTPQRIMLKGIQAGDIVKYAGEDGIYQEEQPEMIKAGVYQVRYQVKRQGYQPFEGTAQVEITKAVPAYTAPVGLQGQSGKTLASVILPKGFVWQTAEATELSTEGTYTWYVNYVPEDTDNYQTVQRIEVKVQVKCPGHQEQSKVTRPATETQKGLRTHTCSLCGNVRTEEIPVLNPAKPGKVSGLKVKKNTSDSLTFTWNLIENAGYYLKLYKGNTLVSTQYVTGNVHSFGGLKAASDYTLQVTPYYIVNGSRVFAAQAGEIRTATAPSAVKFNTVKKSGKNKVKLAWKKISGASGYEIFMKTGKGGYKKIKTIDKGKTVSFTKTGMKKGKTYSFRIRAYRTVNRAKVYGTYSKVKKIKIR